MGLPEVSININVPCQLSIYIEFISKTNFLYLMEFNIHGV